MFEDMLRDIVILVKQDGSIFKDIRASVQSNLILIMDGSLPIEENDKLYRKLPNGLSEEYLVNDRGYQSGFEDIKSYYKVKVQKYGKVNAEKMSAIINVYNASGNNSKININSIDNSSNMINEKDIFENLIFALQEIAEDNIKSKAIKIAKEMKENQSTNKYTESYKNLIATLANHISVLSPFLPILTKSLTE